MTGLQERPALAHPHAFVEAAVTVVFDAEGLAGFRQRWVLDPMTTMTILDFAGADADNRLNETEERAVAEKAFPNLKNFHYFTDIHLDGKPFDVQVTSDFKASLSGRELVYEFFMPCRVKAAGEFKEAKLALYDDSFYTYVAYSDEGGGIDPRSDPLFGNANAPAQADDFQRFSQAVGLDSYKGNVQLEGPVENFVIESDVSEAPEMAYFYGQITPEAFMVRFKRK